MTTTFGVDTNNDLYLGPDKNIVILIGLEAILQACETATRAQLGEMVLEINQGIPNFQTIWVGSPNYSLYTDYILKTLAGVDGVLEVISLQLKTIEDTLTYTATIRTQFGTGDING